MGRKKNKKKQVAQHAVLYKKTKTTHPSKKFIKLWGNLPTAMKDTVSFYLVVSVSLIVGIMVMISSTTWGIGISTDSITYIGVARNLLAGNWFTTSGGGPLTHYPPLYPLLLAITGVFGHDPFVGARWLHVVIYGLNILLVGVVIHKSTNSSILAAGYGALLTASAIPMVYIHSMAWSEPVFILLGLGGLFLLSESIRNTKQLFFILSAVLIGLAFLTRYVGVSLVITGIFGIVLLEKKTLLKKMMRAFAWGGLSSSPILLWVIRNKLVSDSSTNREFVYHPVTSEQIQTAVKTICDWFFLSEGFSVIVKDGFILVFAAAMVIGFKVMVRVSKKAHNTTISTWVAPFFCIATLFLFAYVAVLLFSISFIDAHTPLSPRILSPLYIIGVAGIVCGIHNLLSTVHAGRKIVAVILLIYTSFTVVQLVNLEPYVDDLKKNGRGFSNRMWKQAKILQFIKTLPSDTCIYSNGTDALELFMGFRATAVPRLVDPATRKKNEKFGTQLRAMVKKLAEKDGVLIYFRYITWRWYLPKKADLEKLLRLRTLYKGRDGAVYKIDH